MDMLALFTLKSIQTGDIKSFEMVFKTYYNRLCIYANGYLHDKEQVKLIVNDVFILLWEKRAELNIETSLSGYLHTCVRNHCINYLQREKKKIELIVSDLDSVLSDDNMPNHPVSTDLPIDSLLLDELTENIKRGMDTLPPQCREVFILSRIENLSNEEIAQKLDLSVGTVKSQLFRALTKLRKELSAYFSSLLLIACSFF